MAGARELDDEGQHVRGGAACSVLVGRRLEEASPESATCIFDPLPSAEARAELAALVALYHLGHEAPLPLFPAASKAYVEQLSKERADADTAKALSKARDEFLPRRPTAFSEGSDPYVIRAFGGTDPFASSLTQADDVLDFSSASLRVFEPMLKCRRSEVAG
jgi:exonuclease V gamma subunit